MYEAPPLLDRVIRELTSEEISPENAQLIVYVEMTFYLVKALELYGEPLTVGWVLLSRMPVYDARLADLTAEQRRMWANASVLIPLSAKHTWENAVTRYAKLIPPQQQLYRINPDAPLEDQLIEGCRQNSCPDPFREEQYDEILKSTLPYLRRVRRYTQAGKTYRVRVKDANGEMRTGRVNITAQMEGLLPKRPVWFEKEPAQIALTLTMEQLKSTAEFLDERERQMGRQGRWLCNLKQIRFRKATVIDGQIYLEEENAYPLSLNSEVHLPGLVSAGKTTLAMLIIAHVILNEIDMRITMVVGDSSTAIETAHQINSWFLDDPAGDEVIAVPLLGASQREVHLDRLLASRHYANTLERGQPHWGERWLMPVCQLASQIDWEGTGNVHIPAGNEPCEKLTDETQKGKKQRERYICPFHTVCPSKQMYRDMPQAKVWITTPGALSQATLPLYFDSRIFTLGDLIYEQCDLIILDEVETIVDWYDRTFARREDLTNGINGLLDRLDTQISEYWNGNRVLPPDERRWMLTARDSLKALSSILTSLDRKDQERVTKAWVKRRHFAPHQLAFKLSRRLAGLKEWDDKNTPPNIRHENDRLTSEIFKPFHELLNVMPDPLRLDTDTALRISSKAGELARIMQDMNNLPEDMTDSDLITRCKAWIDLYQPDMQAKLDSLKEQLCNSDSAFDHDYAENQLDRSVDELAKRLYFLLTVALLDRHLHIVFNEWHSKPEELDAQQPFSRIPRGAQSILPLPLTGRQYGFAANPGSTKRNPEAANQLSLYSQTNIGRAYLLNFHHLREDFEGKRGPHILALSGTSYLPDSTPFHVPIQPGGILMPPEQTEQAIRDSRFIWQYFTDDSGKPIQVSGSQDKERELRRLITAMLDYGGLLGGFFGQVLNWLEAQGKENSAQWEDRARILLLTNSYTQAKVVAQTLREGWRSEAEKIYYLKRGGNSSEDYEIITQRGSELKRMDIEQFATATDGRILVAPMQAIGRGFNIMNRSKEAPKAAFGAVFFLTRPMNMPNDMEATAQEMNRYALQWANDPSFPVWEQASLYLRGKSAREKAMELRGLIERRWSYTALDDNAELNVFPRRDLAATTAGRLIQAVGRLLRGGVPFRAYLIDATWSPKLAKSGDKDRAESEVTSLLSALINVLGDYAHQNPIGHLLYGELSVALATIENRDSN